MTKPATGHKSLAMSKPFETVKIDQQGNYTRADILNDGTIQFVVDYPPGKNVCEIELNIKFNSVDHEPCMHILKSGGGTVVIGG
jgi:hypothetical protein